MKRAPTYSAEVVRTNFNDTVMPTFKPAPDHTHGEAAADRSSASSFIDRLASILGRQAYYVQSSRADERNGRVGSRSYYWTKDLTTTPKPLELPAHPLVALVDVDQYIDMPEFLCVNVHPTVIYTVQPDQVSKIAKNYSYTFDEQNQIRYNVTGGAMYSHHVWNYATDHLVAYQMLWGVPYKVASYLVDRRSTSPDHELIMLTPMGSWFGVGAVLYYNWISGKELSRLQVVTPGGYTRLMTSSLEGVQISTGKILSYASAIVPAPVDDAIACIARTSDYVLSMPQVLSFTDGDRVAGAALLEYHRNIVPYKPDLVCPVPQSVRRYQFDPPKYYPGAKPTLVGFMTPLINGAFAPDRTLTNEVQSIKGRIEDVRQPEMELNPFMVRAMSEFAELLVPESAKHSLHPVEDDEVLNRQPRPSQRRVLAGTHGALARRIVQMFLKAEAYPNIKDPRAISIIDPVDKRAYSRYMYAFETILKSQNWYAFSRKPKDIAKRVTEILTHANFAANTDFSRFDGHGSNIMRDLEKQILMRSFAVQYHEELLQLHRAQFNLKAYATFGTKYTTAFSRASGSPETSLFNTLVNAFVAYLALRMTRENGLFLTPHEAFSRLGIYGGDDGLTADVEPETYTKAARWIGQKLTIEPVQRGCPGVKFLARIYSPDVWYGDDNSCCDLPRQVAKLHVCVRMNPNVTATMKLLEKVRSFSLSDLETPIIGDFCRQVLRVHGSEIQLDERTAPMRTWLSHFTRENQYPNRPAEWMYAYASESLPEFEYKRFQTWCLNTNTICGLLEPPTFMVAPPAKSETPVVVDGDVIPYDAKLQRPQSEEKYHPKKTSPTGSKQSKIPVLKKKEVKQSLDAKDKKTEAHLNKPKVKIDGPVVKTNLPKPEIKERAETFEELKARKIAAGTWSEVKPVKEDAKKAPVDPQLKKNPGKAQKPVAKTPKLKQVLKDGVNNKNWRKVQ